MEHRQEHVLDGLKSYWGVRSESYSRQNIEELNNWNKEAWRQLILQYVLPKKSIRILDMGTGPGFFAINLALAGHQVSAVDVTEEMLAYARENAEAYGVEAEFILYDGEHLPFAGGSFDLVISKNVLWNLEKPKAALCEWQRVLVPRRPHGHDKICINKMRMQGGGSYMGIYLDPGNKSFRQAVTDDIYVDKTEMIAFLYDRNPPNQKIWGTLSNQYF